MARNKTTPELDDVVHVSFKVDAVLHRRYKTACAAQRKNMKADFLRHMETQATLYEQMQAKKS